MILVKPSVTLVAHTQLPNSIIEEAGRTCYKSEDAIKENSAESFITRIIKTGHESVLEHAVATFRVVTDRATSHQIVRHRVGLSYSQESQRYCNYSKDKFDNSITFILPQESTYEEQDILINALILAESYYFKLIKKGVPPQRARFILPNATKTELVITGNFRAWRHFLKLRLDTHSQIDIRIIAQMIQKELEKISSVVFSLESLNV